MLWRCEFSPLGHGIFWWNTGNPQQGYIILPCALSLVYRVTEVHHMFKDHTDKHLNSWGEEGEINSKESGSLCHLLSTRHSTVYLPRDGRRMKRWEKHKQRKWEKWPTSPHTLSVDGPFRCWTLPSGWFWLVVAVCWLSGCCPASTLILSGPLVVPVHGFLEVCQLTNCQTTQHH